MTHSLPDEELMLQVRDGVGEMLGVLFARYQSPLFNFCCKMTGDRAVSEDLVQDVFYRILKYRGTYQAGTPFRTWMYHIARNARIDQVKKQRPNKEEEWKPEMSPVVIPGDPVQAQREQELLQKALLKLPEDKREVLVLSRFQEMKYDQIAEVLGIEVGTVKVRVFRALQQLREVYQELERSGGRGGERLNLEHRPRRSFGNQ